MDKQGYVLLKISGRRYKADSLLLINNNIILYRTGHRSKHWVRAETFNLLLRDCRGKVYFEINCITFEINGLTKKGNDVVLNGKIVPTFNGAITMTGGKSGQNKFV